MPRVPDSGDEKAMLRAALERHREVVLWKLDGLDDEQLRRPMTPSGTNLIGLVKHLANVEYGWFCETFGRPSEAMSVEEATTGADMVAAPDETTAEIIAMYERARVAANHAIDELDLDAVGTAWNGDRVSMRWVLIHMLEDTVRHAGHMDIVRELIDGATGQLPPD